MNLSGKRAPYHLLRSAALIVVFAVLLSACGGRMIEEGHSYSMSKEFDAGPVNAVVSVSEEEITTAERLRVHLEVTAPESLSVELPGPEMSFGKFSLVDFLAPETVLEESGEVVRKEIYILEPFLPGEYAFPPLKITYREKGKAVFGEETLATEEIPIKVVSVLPTVEGEPELKDIADIIYPPVRPLPWAIGAGVAALLALFLILWLRRKPVAEPEAPAAPPPPAPHEIALAALERLLAEGLIEKGEIDLFYTRLTYILRHYIEERFGYRAPVQTTEEFLASIQPDESFNASYGELLAEFLWHGDLVKFARNRPDKTVIDGSISTCKVFIAGTQEPSNGHGRIEPAGAAVREEAAQ